MSLTKHLNNRRIYTNIRTIEHPYKKLYTIAYSQYLNPIDRYAVEQFSIPVVRESMNLYPTSTTGEKRALGTYHANDRS